MKDALHEILEISLALLSMERLLLLETTNVISTTWSSFPAYHAPRQLQPAAVSASPTSVTLFSWPALCYHHVGRFAKPQQI